MQIHTTKGIVLRTVKYGETSIIATVYTELYGIQTYMIKGIRKVSKKNSTKVNCFQPAAILEMEVYHHPNKNIQFLKNYDWSIIYNNLYFDVVKNTVAVYVIELLQNCIKQPEHNETLFTLIEKTLQTIDTSNTTLVSNIPIYFTLQLSSLLGFKIQGTYNMQTPVLDINEGCFVQKTPQHLFYVEGNIASIISTINACKRIEELENLHLNRNIRKNILHHLQQYLMIHVQDFGSLKSMYVLQEILD